MRIRFRHFVFVVLLHIAAGCSNRDGSSIYSFQIIEENGIKVAVTTNGPRYLDPLFEFEPVLTLQEDPENEDSLLFGPREFTFGDDGNYYVNLDDKLHKITELKVTNKNGEEIKNLNKVGFDTDRSVRGILIHNDKLLLHHRVKKGREYYVFPGGHIRMNENPKKTLAREFKEETGLDIKVERLFMKLIQEGFAEERFYKVKLARLNQKLFKQNPDVKEDEVNKPVWVELAYCKKLNILPREVKSKIYC